MAEADYYLENFIPPFIDRTWMKQAACRGLDPDMFFPPQHSPGDVRAAIAVCKECPVRDDCFNYAVEIGEETGIWGGRSEKDFRAARRTAKAA